MSGKNLTYRDYRDHPDYCGMKAGRIVAAVLTVLDGVRDGSSPER